MTVEVISDEFPRRRTPESANPFTFVFDLLLLGDTSLLTKPYDRHRELLGQLDLPHPDRIAMAP